MAVANLRPPPSPVQRAKPLKQSFDERTDTVVFAVIFRPLCRRRLELKSQCELHDSRITGERRDLPHRSAGEIVTGLAE